MKKIQTTTAKIDALAEIIVLNSLFVIKSVTAGDAAENALRALREDAPVTANGNEPEFVDWTEWRKRGYTGLDVESLFTKVLPFVVELRDALLNG